ncbi:MAG: DUF4260 domain-containing protein [Flavobacteriales bacterium]|nr:DUF4260 domain-containing protein [Flavobacteriales bacterium]
MLKLEELAQLLICIVVLVLNDMPWWAYLLLAMGPDISMLGYLAGTRTGAFTYNIFHHKGLALVVAGLGMASVELSLKFGTPLLGHPLIMASIILYGHSSMDRMFGYGLKFSNSFQHTHLGWIGKGLEKS